MSLRDRYRTRYNNLEPEWDFEEHYAHEDDEHPLLIRVPAQSFIDEKQNLLDKGQLNPQRYLTLITIHCTFVPEEDEATGEAVLDENENYQLGERLWGSADIDYLESDKHPVGGWLQKLKEHAADLFQRKVQGVEGNSETEAGEQPES